MADKTRSFKASLEISLQAFLIRQESEIMRLPREMRTMTLGELEGKWGGSWAGTLQRIAREKIEVRLKEEEERNGRGKR